MISSISKGEGFGNEAAGLIIKWIVGRWLNLRPRTSDQKECTQGSNHVKRF
jgi:hypothetical protein